MPGLSLDLMLGQFLRANIYKTQQVLGSLNKFIPDQAPLLIFLYLHQTEEMMAASTIVQRAKKD